MEDLYYRFRRWAGEQHKVLKAAVGILVIAIAVLIFAGNGNSPSISIGAPGGKPESTAKSGKTGRDAKSPASERYYVDVSGAVVHPGVYALKAGSRVFEAVDAAGGLTPSADASGVNQAEKITDGQKIVIPAKGDPSSEAAGSSGAAGTGSSGASPDAGSTAAGSLISINSADSVTLQTLPGIGPVTAEKILNYRAQHGSFSKKEELMNVPGIGEKTYAQLKDRITL